jgi:hypothetical protein
MLDFDKHMFHVTCTQPPLRRPENTHLPLRVQHWGYRASHLIHFAYLIT